MPDLFAPIADDSGALAAFNRGRQMANAVSHRRRDVSQPSPLPVSYPVGQPTVTPPANPGGDSFEQQGIGSRVQGLGTQLPEPEPDSEGALSWLLNTLDKPGQAVKHSLHGLLTGDVGQIGAGWLALTPFSETLGLYDPKKENIYGQDLIHDVTGAEKSDSLLSPMGLAGLGVDLVTDPVNWTGIGELTGAGKAIKLVAGHLDEAKQIVSGFEQAARTAGDVGLETAEAGLHAPVHPLMGALVDEAGKAVPDAELVGRLAASGGHAGKAAQSVIDLAAQRGVPLSDVLKPAETAGEAGRTGQRALLQAGGEVDPLQLPFRFGGKYNPVNWLPEVPLLTAPLHLPQKTLIQGTGALEGISRAADAVRNAPGVKQTLDLFARTPNVPGGKLIREAFDTTNMNARARIAGHEAAAAGLAARLRGIDEQPPTEAADLLGDRQELLPAVPGEKLPAEKTVPGDLWQPRRGEPTFEEIQRANKGLDIDPITGEVLPPQGPQTWKEAGSPISDAMRAERKPVAPPVPRDPNAKPDLEDFITPKMGNAAEFSPRDAHGGPRGLRNKQTGKVVGFNSDGSVTVDVNGAQWFVPENAISRPGLNPFREWQAALSEWDQTHGLAGLSKEEQAAAKVRAADARRLSLSGADIPDGPIDMATNAKAKAWRDEQLQALGLDTGTKGQAQGLPKLLEANLNHPAVGPGNMPLLGSVDMLSAENGSVGVGDKLKLAGDEFTVKEIDHTTGRAKLKDGIPIEVPWDAIPHDKGTPIVRSAESLAAEDAAAKSMFGEIPAPLTGGHQVSGQGGHGVSELFGPIGDENIGPVRGQAAGHLREIGEQQGVGDRVLGGAGAEPAAGPVVKESLSTGAPKLPKELAGEKSGYSYGAKRFPVLKFDSDVDRALYIVSREKPSKGDAKYLAWLQTAVPGADVAQLRQMGAGVRDRIKALAKAAESGEVLKIAATPAKLDVAREVHAAAEAKAGVKPAELLKPPVQAQRAPEAAPMRAPTVTLPKDLAGAKPHYGYGEKNLKLKFASDIDKALYIIAQEKPSPANARYLDFLLQALPGKDSGELQALGREVRARIKPLAKAAKQSGELVVPTAEAVARREPGLFEPLPPTASTPTVAKVPTMVTGDMRGQLYDLGYKRADVDRMKPQEAWDAIQGGKTKARETPAGLDSLQGTPFEQMIPKVAEDVQTSKGLLPEIPTGEKELKGTTSTPIPTETIVPTGIKKEPAGPKARTTAETEAYMRKAREAAGLETPEYKAADAKWRAARAAGDKVAAKEAFDAMQGAQDRFRHAKTFAKTLDATGAVDTYLREVGSGTVNQAKAAEGLNASLDVTPGVGRRVGEAIEKAAARGVETPKIVAAADYVKDRYQMMHAEQIDAGLKTGKIDSEKLGYTQHVGTPTGLPLMGKYAKSPEKQAKLFAAALAADAAKGLKIDPKALQPWIEQRVAALARAPKDDITKPLSETARKWLDMKGSEFTAAKFEKLPGPVKAMLNSDKLVGRFKEFGKEIRASAPFQIPRMAIFNGRSVADINDLFRAAENNPKLPPVFSENPAVQLATHGFQHEHMMKSKHYFDLLAENLKKAGLGTEIPNAQQVVIPKDGVEVLKTPAGTKYGIEAINNARRVRGLPPIGVDDIDTAKAIVKFGKRMEPEGDPGEFLKWYDRTTQFFKSYATRAFPANQVRNHMMNRVQSWLTGVPLSGEHYELANQLAAGKQFETVLDGRKFTADQLRHEVESHGVAEGFFDSLLQETLKSEGGYQEAPHTWNPMDPHNKFLDAAEHVSAGIAGGLGQLANGGKLSQIDSQLIESVDRIGHYLYRRQHGWAPAAAAEDVNKALFDYSKKPMTEFEKNIASRAKYFYGYTRGVIPLIASTLVNDLPKIAQLGRLGLQPGKPDFAPPFARGGLMVPLGKDNEGNSKVMYDLDTPLEAAAQPFERNPLADLNPIPRIPLELFSGQDFFLDKPIDEARKAPHWAEDLPQGAQDALGIVKIPGKNGDRFEANPWALWALRNSPLGRVSSTGSRVADTRKSDLDALTNFLTGSHTISIDEDEEKARAQRRLVEEQLREQERQGKVGSSTVFYRNKLAGVASPETTALLKARSGKK